MMIVSKPELPVLLQETPQPPHLLYVEGDPQVLHQPSVAIVGSRAMTPYGQKACEYIATACVRAGLTIVSGLATGIDAIAHQVALDAGGRTIAVLGSGLANEVIFPAGHRHLAERISQHGGAIVSEYEPKTLARRHYFLERNRILAGLTLATIVVEAAYQSGAINTAHHALEANRLVYAVPGSIFSHRSAGCHRLLQAGAQVLYQLDDLFAELRLTSPAVSPQQTTQLSDVQQQLLQWISSQPVTSEQLAQFTGYSGEIVQVNLTELEIQGIVRKNIWMQYEISHR